MSGKFSTPEGKIYIATLNQVATYVRHKIPGIDTRASFRIARQTLKDLRKQCEWEIDILHGNSKAPTKAQLDAAVIDVKATFRKMGIEVTEEIHGN